MIGIGIGIQSATISIDAISVVSGGDGVVDIPDIPVSSAVLIVEFI